MHLPRSRKVFFSFPEKALSINPSEVFLKNTSNLRCILFSKSVERFECNPLISKKIRLRLIFYPAREDNRISKLFIRVMPREMQFSLFTIVLLSFIFISFIFLPFKVCDKKSYTPFQTFREMLTHSFDTFNLIIFRRNIFTSTRKNDYVFFSGLASSRLRRCKIQKVVWKIRVRRF